MTVSERSLANLRPFEPGQSGNVAGRPKNTPLVTPAMRRFASLTLAELRDLWEASPTTLTVAEAIAVTTLIDALTHGSFTTGAKSREQVLERLDGKAASVEVDVNVGVKVSLRWDDGEPV